LRMPRPLWACGWPKRSASSHRVSKHSALSLLGSSRNRRSTPESMESGLVNQLPELFGRDGDQVSRALECPVTSVSGFFQDGYLFGRCSVFPLRVVRGFYLYFAQSDDVRPTDNTDVFAAGGGSQPPAEVFLGVRDRESLHKVFIQPEISLVKKRVARGEGRVRRGKWQVTNGR
jgi:hypothetical protein